MKEVRLYLPDDVKEVAYWDSEFGKLAKQSVETDNERMAKAVLEVRPRPLMSPVSRSEFVSLTERVSKLEEKLGSQLVKVTKL